MMSIMENNMSGNDTNAGSKDRTPSFARPRDTRHARAQSAAYSRTVGVLRWALPLAAFFVLAALVAWPMLRSNKIAAVVAEAIPNLVVENLHLTGLDANNQPYSLTAARALQAGGAKDLVDLEKPQGDIQLNSGSWLAGKAQLGRLDQATKRLWLGGDVKVFHDQGYEFTTSEAQIDLSKNAAWGEKPVLIQGAFGEIRGEGFRILDKGNVVVIQGHATALLNLQAKPSSDKPKAAKPDSAAPEKGKQ